jgi:hypothetical protein
MEHRSRPRGARLGGTFSLLALTCALAACGDDDDAGSDAEAAVTTTTTGPAAVTSTTGAPASGAPAGDAPRDVAAFCEAEIAAERAFLSEDPTAIGPAFEALEAAAPADVADPVSRLLTSAEEGGPEFDAAYAEVIDFMKDRCGFNELEVTGGDYEFEGLPPTVPAGPAIVTFDNVGSELHQLLVLRMDDDATEDAATLASMPEEDVIASGEQMGASFAFPGQRGFGTMDLTPGRYVAFCFIPVGTTPEMVESGGPGGPPSSGPHPPSHASAGMVVEFEVA